MHYNTLQEAEQMLTWPPRGSSKSTEAEEKDGYVHLALYIHGKMWVVDEEHITDSNHAAEQSFASHKNCI